MRQIAVLGGGAAGLMAAISAHDEGSSVTLFEKADRVGRKILATGNGRCNISNERLFTDPEDLSAYHGSGVNLIRPVFKQFGPDRTRQFFASIGILYRKEGDRFYPFNLQASSVQDALRFEVGRRKIVTRLGSPVTSIRPTKKGWIVTEDNKDYPFDAVILAMGGKASPALGSDGEGFAICRRLGLQVETPTPSLVKLKSSDPNMKRLSGVRLEAKVSLFCDGILDREETEEIIFTDDGISGTAVFQISGSALKRREEGHLATLKIDQFPDMDREDLVDTLRVLLESVSYKPIAEALNGFIHKKMIPVLLKETRIQSDRGASSIKQGELRNMVRFLKEWELPVTGSGGFKNAQVTAGGVRGDEIRDDLECIRFPGLFLAGEVIDIDGDCGGYNLQWAFSSGWVAGQEASKESLRFR